MKICYVADARSPIAQNWIRYFIQEQHEVHVISPYTCAPDVLSAASMHVVPVAFSAVLRSLKASRGDGSTSRTPRSVVAWVRGRLGPAFEKNIRLWFGPLDFYRPAAEVRRIVQRIQPDIVHAMRIPFEGLLAAKALEHVDVPLLISVWGNDFTLHADRCFTIGLLTRRAMRRADALHPDCQRDLRKAIVWGFDPAKPSVVLPGNGGIDTEVFRPGLSNASLRQRWAIPDGAPIILNPRGFRAYVRNDTFFRSVPLVLAQRPDAIFLGLSMEGNAMAHRWIRREGVQHAVRLLPSLPRSEMADLFRLADVTVSPSEHDGTPNTLLEGMACGAFPVAGDIESVREWIQHGMNGLLCDPGSPEALARATLDALEDDQRRRQAIEHNVRLVAERAEYGRVMVIAQEYYDKIIQAARRPFHPGPICC